NIAPPGDGPIAECVARAPGGPVHVLVSDREAEHIPGCNMAIRKSCLEAIGGFDPQFRTAGDDVDVCWRLREGGWTLGYHPAHTALHAHGAAVGRRHRPAGRAGVPQRAPPQLSRPPRRLAGPAAAPAAHGRAPPGPAARSAAGPPQRGPHTLAAAWHAAANAALARHDLHLDRALAGAGAAIAHDGGGTPGGRRVRAARGPAHSLGSRGPGRLVRRRPAAHGSGRARRREAADSAPLVARPAAA